MKVILEDCTTEVSIDILNKIPHFIMAKNFAEKTGNEMIEYDLVNFNSKQFTYILRYLTTGYSELGLDDDILEIITFLGIEHKPLNLKVNVSEISKYQPKYIYENNNLVVYKYALYKVKGIYVKGINEYCTINILNNGNIEIFIYEYKFKYSFNFGSCPKCKNVLRSSGEYKLDANFRELEIIVECFGNRCKYSMFIMAESILP